MLSVSLAGLSLPSLIMNASGTFNPSLFGQLFMLRQTLGAIVTKTVTPEPTVGNPQYRSAELPGIGMLNSIGLQNPGLDAFLNDEAVDLKAHGLPVILSISANSTAGFATMIETVLGHANAACVDAFELNLSCPNVHQGGIHFGSSADCVREAVQAVKAVTQKPVFAKLTPNVTQIVPIAQAAAEGGAAGITAINTVMGTAIDIKSKKPVLARISGGYSGPGIKPIALHAVWQIHRHLPELPIMGVGGISCADDVLEFLMAGASVVQVGTSCFRDPKVFCTIQADLLAYAQQENLSNLQALVGSAHL